MSLSFTEYSKMSPTPVANCLHENPKKNKILYMYDCKVPDGVKTIELGNDESFGKTVDDNDGTEREVLYVSGMSGAGKSYFCRKYIEEYHKKYKKRDVFVFSSLDDCPTLDKLKYLKRIKINSESFLDKPLTAEDFKDSLVLFDDVDVILNKHIKAKVMDIMNSILQIGRHFKCTCLVTSHNATAGKETKVILNEAHSIVLFPKCSGNKTLFYIGDQYLGLDKDEIKNLKKIQGRFVCIVRKHPRCIFSLKKCTMIGD